MARATRQLARCGQRAALIDQHAAETDRASRNGYTLAREFEIASELFAARLVLRPRRGSTGLLTDEARHFGTECRIVAREDEHRRVGGVAAARGCYVRFERTHLFLAQREQQIAQGRNPLAGEIELELGSRSPCVGDARARRQGRLFDIEQIERRGERVEFGLEQ